MGLGIVIGGISLYRSYALYEEEQEYNVLKGQIPDFGYDVKFAVTVDGEKSNEIPNRQRKENDYYSVSVSCTNGTTVGEWDYNAWNVKLDDISDGSKCTLAFTGGMSKDDYQKYIEQGIATRRTTYRGKELKLTDAFWTSIQNGTFDDIYVGDYIKTNTAGKNITWLVADIDNYLHTGQTELTKHHLTMIPSESLMSAKMNTTNTTQGGYYGSKMVSGCDGQYNDGVSIKNGNCEGSILDEVYTTYIHPVFNDHVITYNTLLTNKIDTEESNNVGGSTTLKGASIDWGWVDRKLDLMSEVNVYGTTVFSSSGYDTGIDHRQYAIFQLKPEFINSNGTKSFNYWLKSVASSSGFVYAASSGIPGEYYAREGYSLGIRPRFLIG